MSSQANSVKLQTVIAARPGAIREALQSILALSSRLEISGVANGGLSALRLVRQLKPALVVIDSGLLDDEIAMLLEQIKEEQPQTRCLVVAENTRQREAFLALGTDAVVLRSEPTERLVEALEKITLWLDQAGHSET
jgi:DNA-binding NarL/FixJ family response regulator